MSYTFRVFGLWGLLVGGLIGFSPLGGCGSKSAPTHAAAQAGSGGAGEEATDAGADLGSGPAGGTTAANGSGGVAGTGGAASVTTTLDAGSVDLGSSGGASSGGATAKTGSGETGGMAGAGGRTNCDAGSASGGTPDAGGSEAGSSGGSGPACPSDLPAGQPSAFCVGDSLYEAISECHDGGCRCVASRHLNCYYECVKNVANSGGSCRGSFVSCPQQGGRTRSSICFLDAVYNVGSACSPTNGCNCVISDAKTCANGCVELSDGTAKCQP